MKGATHITAGATIGLFVSIHTPLSTVSSIAFSAGALLGSILPDIDNHASKLGRRIGIGSWLIQIFIGHRTVFHSPLLYILLFSLITAIRPDSALVVQGLTAGITSHLLLDMLNPAGIPLLWPFRKRFHILNLRSGGLIDWILSVLLSVATAYLAVHYLT